MSLLVDDTDVMAATNDIERWKWCAMMQRRDGRFETICQLVQFEKSDEIRNLNIPMNNVIYFLKEKKVAEGQNLVDFSRPDHRIVNSESSHV
jgi:hypothetical protein